MEELEEALRHTAKNKAAGTDGIPAEAWMNLGPGKAAMLEFLNLCWTREEFPGDWAESLVVGIFKKGNAMDPANYRPISLLQTAYKLCGEILTARLQEGLGDRLRKTQVGFTAGEALPNRSY